VRRLLAALAALAYLLPLALRAADADPTERLERALGSLDSVRA